MRAGCKTQLCNDLSRLFRHGAVPSGDRALLDRFLADRDEAAFEELVARHGPMVRGVCRRLLVSPHDADDAFQATFLVLVRKAGRLRDADRLGPWLYGVASRVATKARAREARRRERPQAQADDLRSRDGPDHDLLDIRPILDAELGKIPAKLREVLVLCLLEGATAEEASRQLDCPLGTIKSRMARGRQALRSRLIGRGIAPAAAIAAASSAFTSPVSASLTRATLGAIAGTSAAVAPGVAALMRGVAPAMIPKLTVMTSLILGGTALAVLGTATWPKPPAEAQQPGPAEPRQPLPEDGRRRESMNHVKQILLAFHNYAAANGHLPPSAIYGADGQPKLSWRVALLPYLEEEALYNEFRQDEPWDSEHNQALIARMPTVFRTPDSPAPEGQSRLRGFQGKGALFDGVRGIGFEEITDGTSNTLLIAAAREPIVWTRPGELPFAAGQPLPSLNDSDPSRCLVGMADGSAHYMHPADGASLRAIITRSGDEIFGWPVQTGGLVTQPAFLTPAVPTPPPPPAQIGRPGMAPPGSTPPALPPLPARMMPGMASPFPAPPAPTAPPAGMGMAGMMMSGPTPSTAAGMMPGMPPPASPATSAVELRLQRLEEKLDRIMQRLDSSPAAGGKP